MTILAKSFFDNHLSTKKRFFNLNKINPTHYKIKVLHFPIDSEMMLKMNQY